MTPNVSHHVAVVQPALIGSALDCLARFPDGQRLDQKLLVSVAHAAGCTDAETQALLTRVRAAAIVMNDPRWRAWPVYLRASALEDRLTFDAAMLKAIAELPVTADLQFSAEMFFGALLASVMPHGQG